MTHQHGSRGTIDVPEFGRYVIDQWDLLIDDGRSWDGRCSIEGSEIPLAALSKTARLLLIGSGGKRYEGSAIITQFPNVISSTQVVAFEGTGPLEEFTSS